MATRGEATPPSVVAVEKPPFKLVFLTIAFFTAGTLGLSIWLGVHYPMPDSAISSDIQLTSTICKIGFGAIAGLIGGKVA